MRTMRERFGPRTITSAQAIASLLTGELGWSEGPQRSDQSVIYTHQLHGAAVESVILSDDRGRWIYRITVNGVNGELVLRREGAGHVALERFLNGREATETKKANGRR